MDSHYSCCFVDLEIPVMDLAISILLGGIAMLYCATVTLSIVATSFFGAPKTAAAKILFWYAVVNGVFITLTAWVLIGIWLKNLF